MSGFYKKASLWSLGVLFTFFLPLSGWSEEQINQDKPNDESGTILFHFQYGWPEFRYFSQKLYNNFNITTLALGYEKEFSLLPFMKKIGLSESWVLEGRVSHIYGKDIPLCWDQVSDTTKNRLLMQGVKEPVTNWDTYQFGLTPMYRLYYPLTKDLRPYFELGAGFTWLIDELIEEGTRWNFSLYAGLGLNFKICNIPLYTFVRAEHFSNGEMFWSTIIPTNKRLIGPETLVIGLGVRFPL